jgi:hypothetical protein
MAAADVAARPQTAERPSKRRPFAAWVKRFTSLKGGEQNGSSSKEKKSGSTLTGGKHKKGSSSNDKVKNNPYPESGFVRQQSPISSRDDQLSLATPVHPRNDDGSSVISGPQERENHPSNRSKAPTVATIPDTVHSDTGHSKAFTGTTGGALSSIDGAGNGSTFSSPNHSNQSLTTTLTTIQSTSPANTLQPNTTAQTPQGQNLTQPTVMFSHQYPVSPAPSNLNTVSAIPRHLSMNTDNFQSSDNASIVTLASSSKRRRRSMDTDASVRALAPGSTWGGSRESLPLSVLSGNNEASDRASTTGLYTPSVHRLGGIASAERNSIYSSNGVAAPALASERNSFYAGPRKDLGDAKSLRSMTGLDGRSQYDARSINNVDTRSLKADDARSLRNQEGSIRNYEGSIRSGALGHGRNDSIPGSIGSPLVSPGFRRHASGGLGMSRRSSEWQPQEEEEEEVTKKDGDVRVENEPVRL